MITDLRTAEMIKYASNAFLATKISFINEIASVCEKVGSDIKEVAEGMGLDSRIGAEFLNAGIGWGGSCFPKDVQALEHTASIHGCHPQLLRAVIEINRDQRRRVLLKLHDILGALSGKTIAVWGLAFKPQTDDMRGAPSREIIHMLRSEGARVRAFDPIASERALEIFPNLEIAEAAYEAARLADAVVVVTEWNEFKNIDLHKVRDLMRRPVLIDGRNIYDPVRMDALGFIYRGVGRGYAGSGARGEGFDEKSALASEVGRAEAAGVSHAASTSAKSKGGGGVVEGNGDASDGKEPGRAVAGAEAEGGEVEQQT
jgi:UDPglucose 6-dehydrogenase